MNRRRFLELAALSSPFLAGCSGQGGESSPTRVDTPYSTPTRTPTATPTRSPTDTPTDSPTETPTETETDTPTETPRQNPDTIFVGTNGSDKNPGTQSSPLESIQTAIDQAYAGNTIHIQSGLYQQEFRTKRSGDAEEPIKITGPADAVIRPPPDNLDGAVFGIAHSHVHLLGLSFDGLANPDQPDSIDSYAKGLVTTAPPTHQETYPDYLKDVKIKPQSVANTRRKMIIHYRVNNIEIGEFLVTGPAGLDWTIGQESGWPNAEIVSLGRSYNNYGKPWYPWEEPDRSHDVHVHHIANLEGYDHSELVLTHGGMYDVTIEYCSDMSSSGREKHKGAGIRIQSAQTTVRWCDIQNGYNHGIRIDVPGSLAKEDIRELYEKLPESQFPGWHNEIYGNRLIDNREDAVAFVSPKNIDNGPSKQKIVCGNEYNGDTQGNPDSECPDWVPERGTIGHLGGDSPWD